MNIPQNRHKGYAEEKHSCICRVSSLDSSVVQPVAKLLCRMGLILFLKDLLQRKYVQYFRGQVTKLFL